MAEFFITLIVTLLVFLLWLPVVGLLVRPFGVTFKPFIFRGRSRASQSLTFSQHLWVRGVLCWGFGMLMVTTLNDYLDWKYWNGPFHHIAAGRTLFRALLWLVVGLFFGRLTWDGGTGKSAE